MRRSNTKWESFETAMCRTAALRIEAGESMHSQIEWLHKTHIKGRTRSSIRSKIQRFLPQRRIPHDNLSMMGKKFQDWIEEHPKILLQLLCEW